MQNSAQWLTELLRKRIEASQQVPPTIPTSGKFDFSTSPFPTAAPNPNQSNGLPPRNRSDIFTPQPAPSPAPSPAPAPQGPDMMGPHELVGPTRDLAGPMGMGEFEQQGPPISADQLQEIETDNKKVSGLIDQPFYKDNDKMAMMLSQLSNGMSGLTLRGKNGMEKMNNLIFANAQKSIKNNKTMDYLIQNNPEMAKQLMQIPEEYRGDFMKLAMENSFGGVGGMTDSVKSKVQLAKILGYEPGTDDFESFMSGNKSDSTLSSELRKEFNSNSDVKYFADMTQSFNRLVNSVGPDPASDMAMIFNYMKMLDPGSTVREGEYATARNTTGISGQVTNLYNYLVDGNQLNADQRRAFFEKGKAIYDGAVSDYNVLRDQYTALPNSGQLIDHRREFNYDGLDFGDGPQPLEERITATKRKMEGWTATRIESYLENMKTADPELYQALGME
jgi:hypothetical protein